MDKSKINLHIDLKSLLHNQPQEQVTKALNFIKLATIASSLGQCAKAAQYSQTAMNLVENAMESDDDQILMPPFLFQVAHFTGLYVETNLDEMG